MWRWPRLSWKTEDAAALDYLSRHTYCTAIGNERMVVIAGDRMLLRVHAEDRVGKRVVATPGEPFITQLLAHVLPSSFKPIHHHGLLASAAKTERLAHAGPDSRARTSRRCRRAVCGNAAAATRR